MSEHDEPIEPGNDPALVALWDETATSTVDPTQTIKPMLQASLLDLPPDELLLEEELGRGGAGRVVAARHLLLARRVAVKELQRKDASPERWVRFLSEAIITASLEHPNIVPVHELRQDGEGRFQLVMKRVVGRTWRELAHSQRDRSRFEIEDHLEILLRVCDALAFAHDRGVLHLDIKPTNVMVGHFGEVQLMDWGCAHAFRGDWPAVVPRVGNAVRTLHGSPAYMAPEQAKGEVEAFGPWTDVYLLATTMLEVCFDATRRSAGGVKAALAAAARGEVPWPKAGLNRSSGLGRVLARALQSDPTRRFQSVEAFARAIRSFQLERQQRILLRGAQRELRTAATANDAGGHFGNAILLAKQVEERSGLRGEADAVHYDALLAYAQWALEHDRAELALAQLEEAEALASSTSDLADRREHQPLLKRARLVHLRRRRTLRQSRRLRLLVGGVASGVILLLSLVVGYLGERALRRQAIQDALELVQHLAAHVRTTVALAPGPDGETVELISRHLEEARDWYGNPGRSRVLGITVEGGVLGGTVIGERQVSTASVDRTRALAGLPPHIQGYPLPIPTAHGTVEAWRFKSLVPGPSGGLSESSVAVWLDVSAEDFNAASRQLWAACLVAAAIAIGTIGAITLRSSDARAVAQAAATPQTRRRRR